MRGFTLCQSANLEHKTISNSEGGIIAIQDAQINWKKINKRALRFVTCDKSTTYETLPKQLNVLSPHNQRIVLTATGVYKIVHGYKVLKGIGELRKERSTNYSGAPAV